jgi:four helix bundle protein
MEIQNIKSYKDLIVWQKSIAFSIEIYSVTKDFPSTELYGITNQLRRAASSVAANIAEGYGRESGKSYVQFLKTSRGSLYEVDTFLTIARGLNYLPEDKRVHLQEMTEELSKMLNSLIKKLS